MDEEGLSVASSTRMSLTNEELEEELLEMEEEEEAAAAAADAEAALAVIREPAPILALQEAVSGAEQKTKAATGPSPFQLRGFKEIGTSQFTWISGMMEEVDIADGGEELLRFESEPGVSWTLELDWDSPSPDTEGDLMLKLSLRHVRAETPAHIRVRTELHVWRRRNGEVVQVQVLPGDGIVGKVEPEDTVKFVVKLTTYYKQNLCTVCKDFKGLLKSRELADLTFKVDGKDMLVHRQVLCARSQVLKRMLLSGFSESRATEIEIQGIPHQAFAKVLEFLYTGEVEDFEGSEMDVLIAADRYAVIDLKELCQKEIVLQVDASNVLQALVLADKIDAKELKEGSIKVAVDKIEDVMKTPEWVEFRRNHENLVDDILIATRKKNTGTL